MDVSGKARPRSGGGASERVAAPEGATHVVGRQLVQVGVSLSRPHFDEDVVAGVLARDVQPVRVQVGRVDCAVRVVQAGRVEALGDERVGQGERQRVARLNLDRRAHDVAIVCARRLDDAVGAIVRVEAELELGGPRRGSGADDGRVLKRGSRL